MNPNVLLTTCTHDENCPHCKQRQMPKTLPDIKEKPKKTAKPLVFSPQGFPVPPKTYVSKKKEEAVTPETLSFLQMLHKGHKCCDVNEHTVSANANWMGYVKRPEKIPKLTEQNARFGFSGEIIPFEVDFVSNCGLYNHGEDQWAGGYSLKEIGMLLRSNVVSQVRAMLGIVQNIIAKTNGVNRTATYQLNGGGEVTLGNFDYEHYGLKTDVIFKDLWLENDVFASLCEIVLKNESVTLKAAVSVLRLLLSHDNLNLTFRVGTKAYYRHKEPNNSFFKKFEEEEKYSNSPNSQNASKIDEDVIERYLKLGIINRLTELMTSESGVQKEAMWCALCLFQLGEDYARFISPEEKKNFFIQISQNKTRAFQYIGKDEIERGLAVYLCSTRENLSIKLEDSFELVEESERGWIGEDGKVMMMAALIKRREIKIENAKDVHLLGVRGVYGFQLLKYSVPDLSDQDLSEIFERCEYRDLFSALLCCCYAAELIKRKINLKKTIYLPENFFENNYSPSKKRIFQILPTCDWEFDYPYYQLALISKMCGNEIKEFEFDFMRNCEYSPAEFLAFEILRNNLAVVIEKLSLVTLSFSVSSFVIITEGILRGQKSREKTQLEHLEEYLFDHITPKFSEVTIEEAFPEYPDIISIGLCSMDRDIIEETFEIVTELLPRYGAFLEKHYLSVLNLLNKPESVFDVKADIVERYMKAFACATKERAFDPLLSAREEIKRVLDEQKKKSTDDLSALAEKDEMLLVQQSTEYQKMFGYITAFTQNSLNHPLLAFLILPFYTPSLDFIEAVQYSIGYFGKVYPFKRDIYLKTSESNEYVKMVIGVYKRSKKWDDVLAAAISYTILMKMKEDESNVEFMGLTDNDLQRMKKVLNTVFGVDIL
ncbi:hypothetical protein EIN_086680 [Entamoeba invadens IP1]|uniref:hypothetical protein n=1 Tax=Entamoeba invadens IP1 TaxID=370355 RepID=UPI0002C3E423|nr:hypothetical protein EIN_086680 [Entamoeba invadens IP1]ELP85386.1 hypothetical protein EIN_086680 [Entamoeba invadens IP1]|eukprot:XP_004184732.1 hypothetical protein EIN_086680 [Entamoeba invadens IP1]